MDCGMLRENNSSLRPTLMIGMEVLVTGKPPLVQLSSWENSWWRGSVRNKPPFLYRLLKQSIFLLLPVVHRFYG